MLDLQALYLDHRAPLLGYLARRTADPELALELLGIEPEPPSPEVLAEVARRAQLREELAAAMAMLAPGTRDAVRLRVVDELPYCDLAQRLGISETAARVRVSRGLSLLAKLLEARKGATST